MSLTCLSQVGQAVYANDNKSGIYAAKVQNATVLAAGGGCHSRNTRRVISMAGKRAVGLTPRLRAGFKSRIQPQRFSRLLGVLCPFLGMEKVARQMGTRFQHCVA